jgi:hypothetical protein
LPTLPLDFVAGKENVILVEVGGVQIVQRANQCTFGRLAEQSSDNPNTRPALAQATPHS